MKSTEGNGLDMTCTLPNRLLTGHSRRQVVTCQVKFMVGWLSALCFFQYHWIISLASLEINIIREIPSMYNTMHAQAKRRKKKHCTSLFHVYPNEHEQYTYVF